MRDFRDTFAGTSVMQSLDNPGVQLAMSLPFEGALRQLPEADAELLRNIPFGTWCSRGRTRWICGR
ncbi:MAG: hypothetical protein ACLT1X_03860 [Christensenellales bacterium]